MKAIPYNTIEELLVKVETLKSCYEDEQKLFITELEARNIPFQPLHIFGAAIIVDNLSEEQAEWVQNRKNLMIPVGEKLVGVINI